MLMLTKSMAQQVESASVRDQLFNPEKIYVIAKKIDETDGESNPKFF